MERLHSGISIVESDRCTPLTQELSCGKRVINGTVQRGMEQYLWDPVLASYFSEKYIDSFSWCVRTERCIPRITINSANNKAT
jgi:hypothetical protein